jgi:hypothetical protein
VIAKQDSADDLERFSFSDLLTDRYGNAPLMARYVEPQTT